MLKFYPSNRTENLAFVICEIMRRKPLEKVFDHEKIIIQSYGMGTWLQQQVASELGIAAMIDCSMPASFVWSLAEAVLPDYVAGQSFEKRNLRWQIFEVLPKKLSDEKYHQLSKYLRSRTESVSENSSLLATFELASAIADIFDGYQNYRPDWLQAWELGLTASTPLAEIFGQGKVSAQLAEIESWQSDLWRSVFPDIALTERRHRASLFIELERALKRLPKGTGIGLPERVFVFGLSALPPRMLSVIKALAEHIDVHVLVSNPCRYYWGDVKTEYQELLLSQSLLARGVSAQTVADNFIEHNSLLASWGKVGRDYMSLLMEEEIFSDSPVDLFDDLTDKESSALMYLQSDILNLQNQTHSIDREDDSIRFSSCHSALREVEALHDYLLATLDSDSSISARDVIVMVPDIDEYSAYIDAVFSRQVFDRHGQAHSLAYAIADQALNIHQPLLECIGGLLALESSRITGADLLDWLDFPAIRARFNIDEAELELIHHWVSTLNVRWGLNESHKNTVLSTTDAGEANTWLSALKRLIGGYVLGSASMASFAGQNIVPEELFGSDQNILVGKLARVIDVLEKTMSLQSGELSPDEALTSISSIWGLWVDYEALHDSVRQAMTKSLDSISEEFRVSGFKRSVTFSLVAQQVRAALEEEKVTQRFLSGRVNFCTLMPMRSVPFKVVCLLGMNEGKYPRPENKPSFDLLARTPGRVGDRSRRDDDRYLFLEALLSARQYLYISYVGRNIIDNAERYPSVLVSELQEYCRRSFELLGEHAQSDVVDHWTRYHRLQAFNRAYYQSDESSLDKSYNTDWLPLVSPIRYKGENTQLIEEVEPNHQYDMFASTCDNDQGEKMSEDENIETISLTDLATALSFPLKYYYQQTLGLRVGALPDQIEESEPFSLGYLDAYRLKGEILLSREDSEAVFDTWRLSGLLPQSPMDEVYFSQTEDEIEDLQRALTVVSENQGSSLTVDIMHASKRVVGSLVLLGGKVCEFVLSKNPAAALFSLWVKHVVVNYLLHAEELEEGQYSGQSILIGAESQMTFPMLSSEDAKQFLNGLIQMFFETKEHPLPMVPKTAFCWLFESESKAVLAFRGNQQRTGEMQSPYWQRYCQFTDQNASISLPDFNKFEIIKQIQLYKDRIEMCDLSSGVAK